MKDHHGSLHESQLIMTRIEFNEDAKSMNKHSFLLLNKNGEVMETNAPKKDSTTITPINTLHLFDLINKPNFITQCLPMLIRSLRTIVDPLLILRFESYYSNTMYWLLDSQSAQVYLSITDHIYAYKGDINKDSILYPHHLGLQIIDSLEMFKEGLIDIALVNKVWRVFVTLRDRLIHKLLHLKMYSMLPNNSIEAVIVCLYAMHVKGNDLTTVESFSQAFCEVFKESNISNVFECLTNKNRLLKNERVCTFYALYQHYSSINPIEITEWKIRIAERWADERLLLVSSMESQEISTLSIACTLGYVCREDAMKYHCILQGITRRMSSLEERTRSMAMIIGEMISKLLPIENGLKFHRMENEFSRYLYWAFRFGDLVQQMGKCTVPFIETIECIDDSEDDESGIHEDIRLRKKYVERGEAIPKHKTHLIEPKTLQQALDWFTSDKDRVKTTLAMEHMHKLLCTSSALYMNANYLEIARILLAVPNSYNLPDYESELQKCFDTILNVSWMDSSNRQHVNRIRKEILDMMHKMWYGDLNERYRTVMLNLHQRLQMFTRIVMCIDDQSRDESGKGVMELESSVSKKNLEIKYPLLRRIEQIHGKEGNNNNQLTHDKLDLTISITEYFLIPFLKQASMEYNRFFNQAHCNLIMERILLFTALIMDKVALQPIYLDLVQRVLVFVRQMLLANMNENGKSLIGGVNLREAPMIKVLLFNLRQMVNRWPVAMDPLSYAPVLMDIERYLTDVSDIILEETATVHGDHADKRDVKLLVVLWTSTVHGIRELTDTEKLLKKRVQDMELDQKNEIKQVHTKHFIRIT